MYLENLNLSRTKDAVERLLTVDELRVSYGSFELAKLWKEFSNHV